MTTVGIIGAGHIGGALAEGLVNAATTVVISNSRGPETLGLVARSVRTRARRRRRSRGSRGLGDRHRSAEGDRRHSGRAVGGKIVLDTNNYYWERDGHIVALDDKQTTTTQMVQDHLAGARREGVQPHPRRRHPHRRRPGGTPVAALSIASDHADAAALATAVYGEFGRHRRHRIGRRELARRARPARYVVRQDADELRANLARATR
jgi:predicted dinucleotide-binding enzyme